MNTALFNKPRLKQCFNVEIVDNRAMFLFTEHRQFVFEGEIYARLNPLLDGRHSFSEILTELGTQFSMLELIGTLTQLAKRGCLVEAADGIPQYAAFWDYVHPNPKHVFERFNSSQVAVKSLSKVLDAKQIEQAFISAGLRVSEHAALHIFAVDDFLQKELAEINAEMLELGHPWAIFKPIGMVIWISPIFNPYQTACWCCLEHRLTANRQVETFIQTRVAEPIAFSVSKAYLPTTLAMGVNFAAVEFAKNLLSYDSKQVSNDLITFDITAFKVTKHALVKRPQCPMCGDAELQQTIAQQPLELSAQPLRPGNWRTLTAQETYDKYKHQVSPITGVISSLISRDVETMQDITLHNYVAGHYFPMINDNVTLLRVNAVVRSGGKGATEIQAKTGAICESIERYSGIFWGDEPYIISSYAALAPNVYHVRDLAHFSDAQYANRVSWNARQHVEREMVPEKLADQDEIAWTQAWSLTRTCFVYLPMGYCYYGFRDEHKFACYCDSNGNAAGNTLEEAILHGIVELVERDSVALWWYNRIRRQAVDTTSFKLPFWNKMQDYYQQVLKRELHVLDLTTDLLIPTFAVISKRFDHPTEDIIIGLGAHLDARHALTRALEEANQYVPALCEFNEDGSTRYRMNEKDIIDWWRNATFETQPYLLPDPKLPPKRLSDFPSFNHNDVKAQLLECVQLIARADMEVLVINQSRPDIGMPVVKVVIPGLRHFWRRLGPGRLYDIPIKMGWLSQSLREDELNPISCFV